MRGPHTEPRVPLARRHAGHRPVAVSRGVRVAAAAAAAAIAATVAAATIATPAAIAAAVAAAAVAAAAAPAAVAVAAAPTTTQVPRNLQRLHEAGPQPRHIDREVRLLGPVRGNKRQRRHSCGGGARGRTPLHWARRRSGRTRDWVRSGVAARWRHVVDQGLRSAGPSAIGRLRHLGCNEQRWTHDRSPVPRRGRWTRCVARGERLRLERRGLCVAHHLSGHRVSQRHPAVRGQPHGRAQRRRHRHCSRRAVARQDLRRGPAAGRVQGGPRAGVGPVQCRLIHATRRRAHGHSGEAVPGRIAGPQQRRQRRDHGQQLRAARRPRQHRARLRVARRRVGDSWVGAQRRRDGERVRNGGGDQRQRRNDRHWRARRGPSAQPRGVVRLGGERGLGRTRRTAGLHITRQQVWVGGGAERGRQGAGRGRARVDQRAERQRQRGAGVRVLLGCGSVRVRAVRLDGGGAVQWRQSRRRLWVQRGPERQGHHPRGGRAGARRRLPRRDRYWTRAGVHDRGTKPSSATPLAARPALATTHPTVLVDVRTVLHAQGRDRAAGGAPVVPRGAVVEGQHSGAAHRGVRYPTAAPSATQPANAAQPTLAAAIALAATPALRAAQPTPATTLATAALAVDRRLRHHQPLRTAAAAAGDGRRVDRRNCWNQLQLVVVLLKALGPSTHERFS